jgi:multidrug efflux pump subunit AcrA (membrane-fusion protein)
MNMIDKLYTSIFLATVILLQSCGNAGSENKFLKDSSVSESSAESVTEVALVHKGRLSSTAEIPGELQPFQQVDLYAK